MEYRKFLKHQKQGWAKAKKLKHLPLFWEMRLGKTLLTIRWARTRPNCSRILVVCPLAVVESWKLELAEEGEQFVYEITGTQRQKIKAYSESLQDESDRVWCLTNYESLCERGHQTSEGRPKAVPSWLAKEKFDVIICDESTAIRRPTAQITKISNKILPRNSKHRAVLSGLPNPEGLKDFVCQMIFCFGEFMGHSNFYTWRDQFMVEAGFDWVVRRCYRKLIENSIGRVSLTLTREQAGLGSGIVRQTRMVSIKKSILKQIETLNKDFQLGDHLTMTTLENMTLEAKISGGFHPEPSLRHDEKLKELKNLVTGELRKKPFLVWCRFTDEIEGVYKYIQDKLKLRVGKMYGKQSKEVNNEVLKRFKDKKLDCMVLQPKSVSKGIDMSRADFAIVYSNYFDYEIRAQLEARGVHPQKKVPFLVIDICVRGTKDQAMPRTMNDKRTTAYNFLEILHEYVKEDQ